MSMLRSVLTYMGLGPDEDYDDGYLYEADRRSRSPRTGRLEAPEEPEIDLRDEVDPHAQRARPDWMIDEDDDTVDIREEPPAGRADGGASRRRGRHEADRPTESKGERPADRVRPLRAVPSSSPAADDGVGSVPDSRSAKPTVIAPVSFSDAKILADEFKAARPLIMNLQGVERDLARRLIDFASGICYALDGGMEKVASQVFLLTPADVEVSDEERRRLSDDGFRS
ncbi:MAG: cell division protein SepF [Actinomycetota bacterium]